MHTVETIRQNLQQNQKWLERAIIVLWERQTKEEKECEATISANGQGFNAFDAKTLTYYAEYLQSGKHLSGKYLEKAKSMVPKYAKQILEIINNKTNAQQNETANIGSC